MHAPTATPVGIVANNGKVVRESALKGAHFEPDKRKIPLLFAEQPAFMVAAATTRPAERAEAYAKMAPAVACARVPKLTVVRIL